MRDIILGVLVFLAIAGVGFFLMSQSGVPGLPGGGHTQGRITVATEGTFNELVLSSSRPVLVDFSATWCGPCRRLEPVLEELASDFAGRASLVKVDIDQCPNLAKQYQVRGVPYLICFKGGQEVSRHAGALPKEQLAGMLASLCKT
jgi:thioredoxin 1